MSARRPTASAPSSPKSPAEPTPATATPRRHAREASPTATPRRHAPALRLVLPLLLALAGALALAACASAPPALEPDALLDLHADYRIARGVWNLMGSDAAVPDSAPEDLVFHSDEETGAAVALFSRNRVIHIVFRGTRSGRAGGVDRVHNTMMDLDPIPFAADSRHRAHRGFLLRYLALRSEIWNEIDRLQGDAPASALRAYGHSSGAAAALLFALDAATPLFPGSAPRITDSPPPSAARATVPPPLTVTTFGAPRALNRHAAAWLGDLHATTDRVEIVRIRNRGDIVPVMPPALFGYRHPVAAIGIGSHGLLPISFSAHHPGYGRELSELAAPAAARRRDPAAWLDDARALREEIRNAESTAESGHSSR